MKIFQVRFATYRAAVLASRSGGEGSAAEVIMMHDHGDYDAGDDYYDDYGDYDA